MSVTVYEARFYAHVGSIADSLKRIADASEKLASGLSDCDKALDSIRGCKRIRNYRRL